MYQTINGIKYNSFIYLWVDNLKNKFYIGSHFGSEDDGYKFGGIDIKIEFNIRPQDFERKILSYHIVENQFELRKIEKEYLVKYDVENNEKFYNRTNESYGGFHKKSVESRLLDIDDNGLNSFQRAAIKMVETRKKKNSYKTSKIKEIATKKSNSIKFGELKDKISKTLIGSRWVNKNGVIKYINHFEYDYYILDGWSPGKKYSISYEECSHLAKVNNILTAKQWFKFSKNNNLPHNPNIKFKDFWISWNHFLQK